MSEPKHTPGPYKAVGHRVMSVEIGTTVAWCPDHASQGVTADDNAKFFAAAPDLLEACEIAELRSEMQSEIRDGNFPACDDPRYDRWIGSWDGYKAPEQRYAQLSSKCREMRKAAIAKAKGETL